MAIFLDSTIDEKCPKCGENLSEVNMGVNVGKKYCGSCGYNQLQLALGDVRGALLQLEAAIRRLIEELTTEARKYLSKPCGLPREEAIDGLGNVGLTEEEREEAERNYARLDAILKKYGTSVSIDGLKRLTKELKTFIAGLPPPSRRR